MKLITTLTLCCATVLSVSAQKTVLKEAENAMKSDKGFIEVEAIIKPALENPETAKLAQTYYIPGEAGIKQYNDLLGKRQLGIKFPEDGPVTMSNALLGAYDYFMKALPLDSLPDEKGKVKPKYSKNIINEIAGHHNDFNSSAIDLWQAGDFKGAYRAWQIFQDIYANPVFKIKAIADSTLSDIVYNQALAAWQSNENQKAVDAFKKAINLGYNKKSIFEYGIAVANGAQDNDALLYFATEGNKRFGQEDPNFINHIINYYLKTEKYDEAIEYLNKAIAESPNTAQYYALRGIIHDNQDKSEEAMADYQQAFDIDNSNPLALFYLGRGLAAKASALADAFSGNNYEQYKQANLMPMYKQAVDYLEKAYTIDPSNRDQILKILNIVYYQMDDADGMESVKTRQMED